ncbi:hypothetical protein DMUE_2844 [Dictyocoela muelleri]|nr:hypothetical protein DMUE_2844 [Dictyocoela muelleri]
MKYKNSISLFKDSFFDLFKIGTRKVIQILYFLSKLELTSKIFEYTGIDKRAVSKIKADLFQKINTYWLNNHIRICVYRRNVQVDETKLNFNVLSHRGRSTTSAIWVITIVDNTTIPALGVCRNSRITKR